MLSVDKEFLRVSPASQPCLQCFLCFATLSWDPSVLRGPLAGLCSPSSYPHLFPIHSALLTLSGCLVTFLAQAAKTKCHEPGNLGTEIKSPFWGLRSLKLGYQVLFLKRAVFLSRSQPLHLAEYSWAASAYHSQGPISKHLQPRGLNFRHIPEETVR